ncbi:MAG: hypothetical protein IIX96_03170 [Clostridia bacterium]|nr:hypothetical protein [Clostridia bacterium]
MKQLFTFLCILALCLALTVSTYAYDTEGGDNHADSTAEGADVTDGTNSEAAHADSTEENIFEIAYRELCSYSSEIFSALACVCAAILALGYKKGLLPLISGGINGLSGAVDKVKEQSDKTARELSEAAGVLTGSLERAQGVLSDIAEKVAGLEGKLDGVDEMLLGEEKIKLTLGATLEILEEIFMSSSLPVYQKEAIAKKMAALKGVSADNEECTN